MISRGPYPCKIVEPSGEQANHGRLPPPGSQLPLVLCLLPYQLRPADRDAAPLISDPPWVITEPQLRAEGRRSELGPRTMGDPAKRGRRRTPLRHCPYYRVITEHPDLPYRSCLCLCSFRGKSVLVLLRAGICSYSRALSTRFPVMRQANAQDPVQAMGCATPSCNKTS